MDLKVGRWSFVALAVTSAACCAARTPRAETPAGFCAKAGTDDTLRPIPAALVPAVNALFHTAMPPDVAMRMTVFRCDAGHVLVCGMGANLPCGKANTSTVSPGGMQWCQEHPDADFIPAYATGHDTIFEWHCLGRAPAIKRQVLHVDPRGFVAEFWRKLP
jgi:hypothetical protein